MVQAATTRFNVSTAVMSDLISTPSQTQSAVSNEAFEELIDLLASDGIDENHSVVLGDRARTQPNVALRDSSGKLDFDRIRLMFAAQNETHRASTSLGPFCEEKNRMQSPTVPDEDGDSDDHSHRSTSSTVPSRSSSMSPKPAERAVSTCHRRSSTFGDQPWAAIHENVAAAKQDVAPALLRQPLSFDELNAALAGAYEEVTNLRQRYDELQALVSKRLGAETRDQVKLGMVNGRAETRDAGSLAQPGAVVPPGLLRSDVPPSIANLSETEAKTALSALAHSLNLSESTIASMANPPTSTVLQQGLSPPNPTRQYDVASICRAAKFLDTVDELVWRRASSPSGSRTLLPVFSEQNIVALVARLELWERVVRRSSRV